VVIADVEVLHAVDERLHHLRITVAQVVRAAVEVHVDQPAAVDVPQEVAVAATDDEVDPGVGPELGLAGVPVFLGQLEDLRLGFERERAEVVHACKS
jgi:hypothetical protein